jgi:hypothetical protein
MRDEDHAKPDMRELWKLVFPLLDISTGQKNADPDLREI